MYKQIATTLFILGACIGQAQATSADTRSCNTVTSCEAQYQAMSKSGNYLKAKEALDNELFWSEKQRIAVRSAPGLSKYRRVFLEEARFACKHGQPGWAAEYLRSSTEEGAEQKPLCEEVPPSHAKESRYVQYAGYGLWNIISVKTVGPNEIRLRGEAVRPFVSADGYLDVGEGEFEANVPKTFATKTVVLIQREGESFELKSKAKPSGCAVKLTIQESQLVVVTVDQMECGFGHDVEFSGVYRRVELEDLGQH